MRKSGFYLMEEVGECGSRKSGVRLSRDMELGVICITVKENVTKEK